VIAISTLSVDLGAVVAYLPLTTMTTEVSDADLEPRVNRRRPFDLHWRKSPPAWQSNFEMAYGRLHPNLTSDDHCGPRSSRSDHDEDELKKKQDVTFVGKLVAERNSLLDQLNEVILSGRQSASYQIVQSYVLS